ncbi:hypothetical protein JCGZ_19527 [Jatropha curcas]|uniref:GRAS41 protein n=1 Tax=Jatropha curcas TaxID=180498 RepID=A0A067JYC8_JATCU|nr:DELLA protein RGL1 [Jatropha curcas]AMR43785.1 GRAS41 protein [Jatropha curcas]KDP28976.1 hypothetical protein JCGZ_19527 [Jatropha curcas]
MFPFQTSNYDDSNYSTFQDKFSLTNVSFYSLDVENINTKGSFYGVEERGESAGVDTISSVNGLYQDNIWKQELPIPKYEQQEQKQQSFSDYEQFDDLRFPILSSQLQTCNGIEEVGPEKEKACPFSSLQLLKSHSNGFKQFSSGRVIEPSNYTHYSSNKAVDEGLSTEQIMRIAGSRFIQSAGQEVDVGFSFNHPFDSFSGLSDEDTKMVELAISLLASAENIGNQQFDRAGRLLKQCDLFASNIGNPVQRVVYYFVEALRERIDKETGKTTLKGLGKKQSFDIDEAMMTPNLAVMASHQLMPFGQIAQFAGIQAIEENVGNAKRIHIIDLAIRNGIQWTVLMQALVSRGECPLQLLKITAIATTSAYFIKKTGKMLTSFAETMNLPFSFNIVEVSDFSAIKENLLEVDKEETIAVYAEFMPRSLIALPNRLDSVMKMIRNVNPCVMVFAEVEANHNSPTFVNRFIEALFFYSAYFDCLDACFERDDQNRMIMESMYFGKGIRNTIAAEGEERIIRNVKLEVWRMFFARFGMEETELSSSSLFQAELVIKKFSFGDSCMLDKDGKSLVFGWKGTPLHSLSAWKFR